VANDIKKAPEDPLLLLRQNHGLPHLHAPPLLLRSHAGVAGEGTYGEEREGSAATRRVYAPEKRGRRRAAAERGEGEEAAAAREEVEEAMRHAARFASSRLRLAGCLASQPPPRSPDAEQSGPISGPALSISEAQRAAYSTRPIIIPAQHAAAFLKKRERKKLGSIWHYVSFYSKALFLFHVGATQDSASSSSSPFHD
jgi:hypothetical protein